MLEELSIELKALLQSALALHKENRWAEAQALYEQALALSPKQPKTLQLFTLLARQTAQWPLACQLLKTALEANPLSADLHYDLGLVQSELAQLDQSIASFLRATELQPLFPEAYYNLGNAYYASGDREKAALFYGKAAQQNPLLAEAHYNLGLLAQDRTDYDSAISCYRQALACRPDYSEAWLNLGLAYKQLGQLVPSAESFSKALELRPDYLEAWLNLAMVHQQQHSAVQAEESLRRALELQPDNVPALLNYAMLLESLGRLDEALLHAQSAVRLASDHAPTLACLAGLLIKKARSDEAVIFAKRALEQDPEFVPAQINLSQAYLVLGRLHEAAESCEKTLQRDPFQAASLACLGIVRSRQGRFSEALEVLKKTVTINPSDSDALINLAICELLLGDYQNGWKHYEARWQSSLTSCRIRSFSQPRWKGESFSGKTLLLHAEQGFGDTIQFIRYAPMIAKRGGRVILECQPTLKQLLRSVEGIDQVISQGDTLPDFEIEAPLLSLPEIFQTTLESIPDKVPYIRLVPNGSIEPLPITKDRLKIGLVWCGSGRQNNDPRPIPFEKLLSLLDLPNTAFFSFQLGAAAKELNHPVARGKIHDLSSLLTDFTATAELIMQLDLFISIDTSVAHLAGALGRPVWTLLPFAPDWRWHLNRDDSPWYPTMRLFRQSSFENWDSVIEKVKYSLLSFQKEGR